MSRLHAGGLAALVLLCGVYLIALDRAPRMLGSDEAHFATHAASIAATGRDLNGTLFPFFIFITHPLIPNYSSHIWYQPFLFYVLALVFQVLPFTEWSVRIATATIAVVDIWLVYAIGRLVFKRKGYAVIAALILAMTPAHLIMSRQALDYIGPVPFVLGWLWLVAKYRAAGGVWRLAVSGLLLGCGTFTYVAAWILAPTLLAVTTIVLFMSPDDRRAAWAPIAGYLPPIALGALWVSLHPNMLFDTINRYELARDGSRIVDAAALQNQWIRRLTVYWDSFSPSFLFFGGGSNRTMSTAQVGVFLLPVAILLVVGLVALWKRRSTIDVLLATAFVAAPLPVVISLPEPVDYNPGRVMVMLPVAALIATIGAERCFADPRLVVKVAASLLLVAMPLQYARFVIDYTGDYQRRAAHWLDPINTGAVANAVIAQEQAATVPAVYLRDNLDEISVRWKFYMDKSGRADLWKKSTIIYPASPDPQTIKAGSLIVLYTEDPMLPGLLGNGYSTVATIDGIDGQPNSTIVRRDR